MAENISANIDRLLKGFIDAKKTEFVPREATKVKVDKIVSKLALLYEKLRNVIDYNEERLIRRNAIKRILKRKVLYKILSKNSALPLTEELIRAAYLENDKITESKVKLVADSIDKYLTLRDCLAPRFQTKKLKNELTEFILGILACEIEEILVPELREKALVDCMYSVVRKNVPLQGTGLSEKELDIIYYVNVYRALLKYDPILVNYLLFKLSIPNWSKASKTDIDWTCQNFLKIRKTIDKLLTNPNSERLHRLFKQYTIIFLILRDIIDDDPSTAGQIFSDPQKLNDSVREAVNHRYKMAQGKLRRSLVRSIIYIFITKMLLALILEFPVDIFIEKKINYTSLITNITFPPLLMLLVGASIRVPSTKNTDRIVRLINEIVYEESNEGLYQKVSKAKAGGFLSRQLFRIVYLIMYVVTFGLIIYLLRLVNFNAVNIVIFLLFLSVVSFFGFRIRQSARELKVLPKRESFLTLMVDFFSIPILKAGRWLSLNLSRINIFIFIMDIIIEAPFKTLIEIFEDWLSFIREKKEEIT